MVFQKAYNITSGLQRMICVNFHYCLPQMTVTFISKTFDTYFSVLSITPSAISLGTSLPKVVSVKSPTQKFYKSEKIYLFMIVGLLTQNGIHDDQCDIMFDVKFSLITFLFEMVNALNDTSVKDWNVAVQDW
jgi:hypothetical protein